MSEQSRLPTLGVVVTGAQRALVRFPLVCAVAVVATVSGILAIEEVGAEALRGRLLAVSSLGIPLFVALALYAEQRRMARFARLGLEAIGVGLLVGFYLAWHGWSDAVRAGRYIQLSAAFHLLVAFLPYVGRREPPGFWEYNRTLLERLLQSALYTVVLYAGFSVALAAVDQLFGIDVPGTGYARLWILAAFVVNTWLFLAGLPEDLDALDESPYYSLAPKAFAQYALIPIVVMYLAILMIYFAKVLITWDWPSGWIGYLVSGVAVAGIFAVLLLHPVADQPANRWMRTYTRGLFIALLPTIVMLWLAIWQRVQQYGITERRYFLTVLSVWLAGISLYYAITRSRGIKLIPASLCVIVAVTFGGPWGAYHVSRRSQTARLATLLARNGRLAEGRVRAASGDVPFEDRREISAALRYLIETHGTGGIASWFGDSIARVDTIGDARAGFHVDDRAKLLTKSMGIEYVSRSRGSGSVSQSEREAEPRFRFGVASDKVVMRVSGFDYVTSIRRSRPRVAADTGLVAWAPLRREVVEIRWQGAFLLEVPLDSILEQARIASAAGNGDSGAALRVEAENERARAAVVIWSIEGREAAAGWRLAAVSGDVAVRIK